MGKKLWFGIGFGMGFGSFVVIDPETTLVNALWTIVESVRTNWPLAVVVLSILLAEYELLKKSESVTPWIEAAQEGGSEFIALLLGFFAGACLLIQPVITLLILVLAQLFLKLLENLSSPW